MTDGLRIAEVAEAADVSTATIRYYERIGVLPQPVRAANGYRVYRDDAVDRLRFISRAKRLGCTLGEIADLVRAWDGGECGPVQDQLRSLVTDKLATTQADIVEMIEFSAELHTAAAALERHRPVGPCDDDCGCASTTPSDRNPPATAFPVALIADPDIGDTPVVCTLAADVVGSRLADWNRLLDRRTDLPGGGVRRSAIPGGVRLDLGSDGDVVEIARLASAEQECCRFFGFAITVDDRGVGLEVTAPDSAIEVVHAAFGAPR